MTGHNPTLVPAGLQHVYMTVQCVILVFVHVYCCAQCYCVTLQLRLYVSQCHYEHIQCITMYIMYLSGQLPILHVLPDAVPFLMSLYLLAVRSFDYVTDLQIYKKLTQECMIQIKLQQIKKGRSFILVTSIWLCQMNMS